MKFMDWENTDEPTIAPIKDTESMGRCMDLAHITEAMAENTKDTLKETKDTAAEFSPTPKEDRLMVTGEMGQL